jgi:hypothetical protein
MDKLTLGLDSFKVKEIEQSLEEFEKQVAGLPEWKETNAPNYLSMPLEQLRKKTPEELSEAAYELNVYALNIQRLLNRLHAWNKWGKSKLDEIATEYIDKVSTSYGWQERLMMIKNHPKECKQLNRFIRGVEMKIQRLYGLPDHIRFITESIRDIRFTNMRREKDG